MKHKLYKNIPKMEIKHFLKLVVICYRFFPLSTATVSDIENDRRAKQVKQLQNVTHSLPVQKSNNSENAKQNCYRSFYIP